MSHSYCWRRERGFQNCPRYTYMYAYPVNVTEELEILIREATRIDPAPLPEAVQASWSILGWVLSHEVPIASAAHNTLDTARVHVLTNLISMRDDRTPQKLGDGTFLKKWGPVLMPIILNILKIWIPQLPTGPAA